MSRLLRPVPGVDFKKLPLSPAEGNVYSRVDGKHREDEIISLSGMRADTVKEALAKLIELKAIEVVDEQALQKDQQAQLVTEAIKQAFGGHVGKGKIDESLLREEVELDEDKKRLFLDAFQRLDQLNYYELLGLHPLVDKKEVKAAYYAIAPSFHPDKFYRKNLGSYRARIEAIFARLTLAHDVLSSRQRRGEYDTYLETLEQNRRAQEMLGASQQAFAHVQAAIEARAREAAQEAQTESEARRLADRKRALAAKLGRGRHGSSPAATAANEPAVDPRAAAEALRVRYEYARAEAQRGQIESYVTSSRGAAAKGDYPSAANYMRVALSLVGNDAALQAECAEYARLAAVALPTATSGRVTTRSSQAATPTP
jgi:curved DNA-binding protein CbpA